MRSAVGRASALVSGLRGSGKLADSAWGMGFEVASVLGTLISFTLLGRTLGAVGYGEYASLYAIIGPLVTLAASGVVLALLQHLIRDKESLEEAVRSCISLTLLLGLSLMVVGSGVAFTVVDTLSAVAILSILLIEFVTTPLVFIAAATVQAEDSYSASVRVRLALVLGRIVILIALFASDSLTVASLGVSQLVLTAILASISLRWIGRAYGFNALPGRIRARHMRTNLVYSSAISADAVANDGDKVVLAANDFVVDTGLYAAAYRIIGLGQVPVGVLVSMSHKRFLESEEGLRREHLDLAIRYSLVAGTYGILFGLGVYVVAPLFPLVMGEEFEGSVTILRWLAPIVFLRAIGIFSLNGLMGLGKVGVRTIVIVLNAVFSVVLFLLLIPDRGWEGAVIASMLGEVNQVVLTWTALIFYQRRADRALDESIADMERST